MLVCVGSSTRNRVCSNCTQCSTAEFVSTPCTVSSDTVCSAITSRCGLGQFESALATGTSDRTVRSSVPFSLQHSALVPNFAHLLAISTLHRLCSAKAVARALLDSIHRRSVLRVRRRRVVAPRPAQKFAIERCLKTVSSNCLVLLDLCPFIARCPSGTHAFFLTPRNLRACRSHCRF
jgi:hypothetical protein